MLVRRTFRARGRVLPLFLVALLSLADVVVVAGRAAAEPPTPRFGLVPVDLYGPVPPYECLQQDPHREGVERFSAMVLAAYSATTSGDGWAPCDSHSPTSLHHTGRAWDWVLAPDGEAATLSQRAHADELLRWLLEPVQGQPHARARRLGIVEIIWFDHLWTSHTRKWDPYPVLDCTQSTDNTACHRDHVHFTFSRPGADANTSWWRGLHGFIASTLDVVASLATL